MQIQYLKYQAEDFDYCNDVIETNMQEYFESAGEAWDRNRYRNALEEDIVKIVWWNGNRVGFIQLSERGVNGYLNSIQISPLFRNQGLGSQMLSWIEKEFKAMGKLGIQLSVYKTSPAFRLYQKLGYEVEKDRGTKYLMKKLI